MNIIGWGGRAGSDAGPCQSYIFAAGLNVYMALNPGSIRHCHYSSRKIPLVNPIAALVDFFPSLDISDFGKPMSHKGNGRPRVSLSACRSSSRLENSQFYQTQEPTLGQWQGYQGSGEWEAYGARDKRI